MARPNALRVLIAYKSIKGGAELLVGLVAVAASESGHAEGLRALVVLARHHFTARLSVELVDLVSRLAAPGPLTFFSSALALDGLVGLAEAWLLHRRKPWALWLVVAATSLLIPWEVVELVGQVRPSRVIFLGLNLAVIAFLSWQARRHAGHFGAERSPA